VVPKVRLLVVGELAVEPYASQLVGEQLDRAGAPLLRCVPLTTGGRPDAGPQDDDTTECILIHRRPGTARRWTMAP
jgi:hypothetical protein